MDSPNDSAPRSPLGLAVITVIGFVAALAIATLVLVAVNASNSSSGGTVHVTVKEWSVTADRTVRAGNVTFVVTNAGSMEHELLVLQTDTPPDRLPLTNAGDPPEPVTSGADRVSEDDSVGETGSPSLQPGESRTFTIDAMEPGNYVLLCNLAGHYARGMHTGLVVVP